MKTINVFLVVLLVILARIRILVLLAVVVFACSTVAAQPMLYWADQTTNKIQRLDLAQSVVEDVVVAPLAHPGNIALDFERGHMYWSNTGRNVVVRANIDGTDVRQIMAGYLVGLEAGANKLYVVRDSTLHRANLDGSQGEVLLTMPGLTGSCYILPPVAIDLEAEKVYWVSWYIDRVWIRRANLDGTEQELFFDETTGPGIATIVGLFVDTAGGKLYMQDALGVHNFHQVNLDGSGFKVLDHIWVIGIAVDGEHGKVYWVESTDQDPYQETSTRSFYIRRSNLDGSDLEPLIPIEDDVTGIALDASNNVLVWISASGIWRSQLDGSQVEQVVVASSSHYGIRVDPAGGHIYWTNGRAIGRHDLDDLHEEIQVDSLQGVVDVALDPREGFLYWALVDEWDPGSGRIQRSRVDGSDVEDVVSLPHRPYALEVDVQQDRLFWTSTAGIFTARRDGSAMTRIASLGEPYDIRLDVGRERIYWLDYTSERGHELGWTSMDGSVSEVLYEGGRALTVDALNGYVYWAGVESEQGTLWRGSLNGGSEKELVATGLGWISSLAIDPAGTSTHIASGEVPGGYDLGQNYPNPFNPTTTIAYTLARPSDVTLTVYDVLARQVRVLVSATRPAGTYTVSLDATGLPSGVYLYRLEAGAFTEMRKMVVLK